MRQKEFWPSWRYGPNGEAEIFQSAADVPYGWVARPGQVFVPPEAPPILDPEDLARQLEARGIIAPGHWPARYMKEVLDGSSTPR